MNKKGFTLIELMAVIILLAVLSLIAVIGINETLKKNKHDACEIQKQNIASAASIWGSKNPFSLPSYDGGYITITLGDIKQEGLIDKDIKNPNDESLLDDNMKIRITRVDNDYKYEVDMEC